MTGFQSDLDPPSFLLQTVTLRINRIKANISSRPSSSPSVRSNPDAARDKRDGDEDSDDEGADLPTSLARRNIPDIDLSVNVGALIVRVRKECNRLL